MVTSGGRARRICWWAVSIGALTLCLAVGVFGRGASQEVEEPLVVAMEGAGITVEEATVDLWSRLDDMAGDEVRQTALADRVAELITGEVRSYDEVRAGRKLIRRSGAVADARMAVAVAENITSSGAGEVCLAVRLSGSRSNIEDIVNAREQIMAIGENFGGKIAINTCLRGYISGKLKSTEKTAYTEALLTRMNAKQVSIDTHERYISCTAYSPDMEGAVRLGGENINLHIVFRETDERTEVYIGAPLLMMEY